MPTTIQAGTLASAPAYAVLPAESIDRARAFYRDVLGLPLQDYPEARQFIAQAGSGTRVLVYERPRTTAEQTTLGFQVPQLDKTMAELRERGVRFEEYDQPGLKTVNGVAQMGNTYAAWFRDSEGNIISLAQMGPAEAVSR